ncbi:hypothetical protein KAI78_04175 [bacterium]|nr:hypothetical protein [bacterium]
MEITLTYAFVLFLILQGIFSMLFIRDLSRVEEVVETRRRKKWQDTQ